MDRLSQITTTLSPLEQFIRDYVEARDGAWDEIEPQVYDLLIGPDLLQVAFDPEALPEHPGAQLASLGSPLLDRLLNDAAERWSSSRFYRIGLNLHPYNLELHVRRAVSLPQGASITVEKVRTMNCPQALFWFKATFASDQKEEEILSIGIDLHYMREFRHLESLLAPNRLSEAPEAHLPEAPHGSLAAGYRAARQQLAPTIASLANIRRREWTSRVENQIARMTAYYAQLRLEADELAARANSVLADPARAAARRDAIDREEQLRIAELRQKSAIQTRLKLAGMMLVQQPKLLISAAVFDKTRSVGRLDATWDPLSEAIEPIACPACARSTFALRIHRSGLRCENCPASSAQ